LYFQYSISLFSKFCNSYQNLILEKYHYSIKKLGSHSFGYRTSFEFSLLELDEGTDNPVKEEGLRRKDKREK
jgi:hypothetical protein